MLRRELIRHQMLSHVLWCNFVHVNCPSDTITYAFTGSCRVLLSIFPKNTTAPAAREAAAERSSHIRLEEHPECEKKRGSLGGVTTNEMIGRRGAKINGAIHRNSLFFRFGH